MGAGRANDVSSFLLWPSRTAAWRTALLPPTPVWLPGTHLRLLHKGFLPPAQLPPQQLQGRPVLQGPGIGLLGGLWKSPRVSPKAVGSICGHGLPESGGGAVLHGVTGSFLAGALCPAVAGRLPCTYPGQGRTARVLRAQGQELLPWPQEGPQLLPQILILSFLRGWGREAERWGCLS